MPFGNLGCTRPKTLAFAEMALERGFEGYLAGNGYRAYLPGLMRWANSDDHSPFGPGGANSYVYCMADPVNRADIGGATSHSVVMAMVRKLALHWRKKAQAQTLRKSKLQVNRVEPHVRQRPPGTPPTAAPAAAAAAAPAPAPAPARRASTSSTASYDSDDALSPLMEVRHDLIPPHVRSTLYGNSSSIAAPLNAQHSSLNHRRPTGPAFLAHGVSEANNPSRFQ
ncbi:RHS repeat-associated core domain-containing protein [Pseudomonas sp. URIL14HWK12:I12]